MVKRLIGLFKSLHYISIKNFEIMSQVKVGSKIPFFKLKNQNNQIIDIEKLSGNKNLVIYFFPKDDTPGCTAEACSFRDEYEDFKAMDAEVIGISADSPATHKNFAFKYNLSFTLLSDIDKKVRKQFGVPSDFLGLIPGRVTYIVGKDGIVKHIFNSQFNATKHVSESIRVLESL